MLCMKAICVFILKIVHRKHEKRFIDDWPGGGKNWPLYFFVDP